MRTETAELSSVERSRLVEERDHLLVSLDDLDAEFQAGDLAPDDYVALKDDYTARAAELTRALRAPQVRRRATGPSPIRGRLVWIAVVTIIAGLAAIAMVQFSGARGSGETASGEIRQSSASLLSDAAAAFGAGEPDRAIELYGEVLELQPSNVEALTYRGWVRYQAGDVDAANRDFDEAVAFDPDYADVRVFRAVSALDREDYGAASAELAAFDRLDPAPVARQLVAQRQLRERVAVARVLEAIEDAGNGVPDLARAGIGLAEAQLGAETLVQLANPNDALFVLDAILAEEPESAPAMAWRGWTLALTAESGATELFPDAELWLDRAVAAEPDYPDAHVFRAFVLRRLDRIDEAAEALRAFDMLPHQPADMLALIDQFDLRDVLDS